MFGPSPIHHSSRAHSSLCVCFYWIRCSAYLLWCSSSSPDPSIADTQGFYLCQMPEHGTSIQPNSAQSRSSETGSQTPNQYQNIQLIFRIKDSVFDVVCCCVYNTDIYNCITRDSVPAVCQCCTQHAADRCWQARQHRAKLSNIYWFHPL